MKKFLAGIAAAAIITVPMTSFALESMSKGALKNATGQAGVSIALDNIVIYQSSTPTVTYWDTDGTSMFTGTAPGTIGSVASAGIEISYTTGSEKLTTINAVLDATKYGVSKLTGATGTFKDAANIGIADAQTSIDITNGDVYADVTASNLNNANANNISGISPLTIDVGTCQALSQGLIYNKTIASSSTSLTAAQSNAAVGTNLNVAGVVIGLPTVEINTYHTADRKAIKLVTSVANTASAGAINKGATFIEIEKSGKSTMAILGGRLEIAPH